MKSGKNFSTLIIVLLLALALPNLISLIRGPAPTPDIFEDAYTLSEAREIGLQENKPVLVLATADWCAPCQSLKRGALSDPEVAELIRQRTIPVYLEDGQNRDEIASLGVRSYPTTLILDHKGEVASMFSGGASSEGYAQAIMNGLPQIP